MRGDDDLADILTDLADFMRYNLRNPSQHIPLSQELEVIDRFIRIQQSCGKADQQVSSAEEYNEWTVYSENRHDSDFSRE